MNVILANNPVLHGQIYLHSVSVLGHCVVQPPKKLWQAVQISKANQRYQGSAWNIVLETCAWLTSTTKSPLVSFSQR